MDIIHSKEDYDRRELERAADREVYKKETEVADKYSLDHIDRLMLRHLLYYPKARAPELGKIVGLSDIAISRRKARPVFRLALQDITAGTADLIQKLKREAAQELRKLIKGGTEATRARVALAALEAELAPKQYTAIQQNVVFHTTIDEMGVISQKIAQPLALEDSSSSAETLTE